MQSEARLQILLAILCISAVASAGDEPSKGEAKAGDIRGEWIVEKVTDKGREISRAAGGPWNFEETRIEAGMPNGGRQQIYAYSVDTTTAIPSIDLLSDGKTDKRFGIYEINDGRLRLCFAATPGGEWPDDFEAGENCTLIVLKRKDTAPPLEEPDADAEASSDTVKQVVVVETSEFLKPVPVSQSEIVRLTFDEASFRESSAKITIEGPAELIRKVTRVERTSDNDDADSPPLTQVQKGSLLYVQRGCAQCHSTDGKRKVGPGHGTTFGEELAFADGTTARGDEAYIRDSIINPKSQVRRGFPPAMPSFKGILTDVELDALVAFVKSRHPDHKPPDEQVRLVPPPRHVELEVQPTGEGEVTVRIEFTSYPDGELRKKTYYLIAK